MGNGEDGTNWEGSIDVYKADGYWEAAVWHRAQLGALWWPRGVERGGLKGRVYMYTYGWFTLLHSIDEHNVVKQLYPIKKRKNSKAKVDSSVNELNKPLRLGLGNVFSPKAKPKEDSLCYVSCVCGQMITSGQGINDKACAVLAPVKTL